MRIIWVEAAALLAKVGDVSTTLGMRSVDTFGTVCQTGQSLCTQWKEPLLFLKVPPHSPEPSL